MVSKNTKLDPIAWLPDDIALDAKKLNASNGFLLGIIKSVGFLVAVKEELENPVEHLLGGKDGLLKNLGL